MSFWCGPRLVPFLESEPCLEELTDPEKGTRPGGAEAGGLTCQDVLSPDQRVICPWERHPPKGGVYTGGVRGV